MRRNVEAFLAAPYDAAGQAILHEFTQYELQAAAADFEVFRESRRELYDPMIQEGRPYFQGMSHAHAVDFGQDIVGQITQLIHAQEAAQSRGGAVPPARCGVSRPAGGDLPPVPQVGLLAA